SWIRGGLRTPTIQPTTDVVEAFAPTPAGAISNGLGGWCRADRFHLLAHGSTLELAPVVVPAVAVGLHAATLPQIVLESAATLTHRSRPIDACCSVAGLALTCAIHIAAVKCCVVPFGCTRGCPLLNPALTRNQRNRTRVLLKRVVHLDGRFDAATSAIA